MLLDRDLLFESTNLSLILYTYTIKSSIDTILVRNESIITIRVYKKIRLRYITKDSYNNYILVKNSNKIVPKIVLKLLAIKIY